MHILSGPLDLATLGAVAVTLEPGDALFMPMGWSHKVRSLEISVNMTFDRFDVPGDNAFWRMA